MQQTNPYNDVRLSQLKMWLNDQADKGSGKYFEVYVDDIKVIPRTNKTESFDDHKVYIDENTETVKVFTYGSENSNRYQQFTFVLEKRKPIENALPVQIPQTHGLSGIELENKINERLIQSLAQERERWQNDLMKREYETCKINLAEAEGYIDELEEKLREFKNKKLHFGNVNLGDVASIVLEGMVRRNPHWIAKLPGGDALAGLIMKESSGQIASPEQETEVVIQKKTASDEPLSKEEKAQLAFLKQLESHFNQDQLNNIMQILQAFADEPKDIDTVYELLEIKKENEKV